MKIAYGVLLVVASGIASAQVPVSVNLNANVHPISPLIFGVALREDYALGQSSCNLQTGYTVCRWGGNSTTRYNWLTDFANHAQDWYFENIPNDPVTCSGTPPANSSDAFVYCARASGAQPLLTVSTIGYTPRADSPANRPYFSGFLVSRYGAQIGTPWGAAAVDPYDTIPDAGSGFCDPNVNTTHCSAGGYIVGNDWRDTSEAITSADDAAWVAHLQAAFGTAANGGVKFYTLDNEVMLWNSTHHDVHPSPTSYAEVFGPTGAPAGYTVDYAAAIKTQEPNALVTGPVTWGYCDLFGSAADNCADGTDRANHGGIPFVAWYLQQVCTYKQQHGLRLIDYLDLHYYPQGNNVALSDADDATTAGLRLRSLKELYDSTWPSESWIADLGDTDSNHYSKPNLIPRVRQWINDNCPGTKLAITEYNWGNDSTNSGAVAQAEVLGIFAREGVDLATRWVAPDVGSQAERGFRIFLNYDGAGAKVQGDSVSASSGNVDQIGAYAFRDYGQRTMLLLTNKGTVSQNVALTFTTAQSGTWKLYSFDPAHDLHLLGSGSISGTALTLNGTNTLPAMSANLWVIPDNDGIFKNGFEGP